MEENINLHKYYKLPISLYIPVLNMLMITLHCDNNVPD